MDSTLRGNFPIAQGIAIGAAALLAAWLVNQLNESEPEPAQTESKAEIRSRAKKNVSVQTLNRSRLAGLLGMPELPARESAKGFEVRLDIGKSALRFRLLGTLTSALAEWTFASILDLRTQSAHIYRVGDPIEGAEIEISFKVGVRAKFASRAPGNAGNHLRQWTRRSAC